MYEKIERKTTKVRQTFKFGHFRERTSGDATVFFLVIWAFHSLHLVKHIMVINKAILVCIGDGAIIVRTNRGFNFRATGILVHNFISPFLTKGG